MQNKGGGGKKRHVALTHIILRWGLESRRAPTIKVLVNIKPLSFFGRKSYNTQGSLNKLHYTVAYLAMLTQQTLWFHAFGPSLYNGKFLIFIAHSVFALKVPIIASNTLVFLSMTEGNLG